MTKTPYFEAAPTTAQEALEREDEIPVADSISFTEEDEAITDSFVRSTPSNPAMVQILAPANLYEGYKFDATYNGVSFPVIVPAGGCIEGQMLVVPFNPNANTDSVGLWKDNLFACTRYGLAHPSFLSAYFCPLILLGQIMTRLKMDWRGNETSTVEWNKTFRTMLLIAIFCKIIIIIDYISVSVLASAVVCFYWIYLWYLLLEVRKHIRDRDRIPADHGLIGDAIKSFFCTCCTISQLARQTANYDVANASFCTQNGLVLNQAHTIDGDVEIV